MLLVKLLTDDGGGEIEDPVWHLSVSRGGGEMAMCTGEFYGLGESGCKYKTKSQKTFGKNCPDCIEFIKEIKNIKL